MSAMASTISVGTAAMASFLLPARYSSWIFVASASKPARAMASKWKLAPRAPMPPA